MIRGVGTDIVATARMAALFRRHGERALAHFLAAEELDEGRRAGDSGRFLAKRFAAKEALAKALGCGLRAPVLLTSIAVRHDALGRPEFGYGDGLAEYMARQGLRAHLSISDERDFAVAFVVVESA